jgi:hypothetical protein
MSTNIHLYLIAPCGMDCGICMAFLRKKYKCPGCNSGRKVNGRLIKCGIRLCKDRKGGFCFECDKYPCDRLKRLDKRYQEKYGMSEIDNLNKIKEIGLVEFMKIENTRWACPKCGNPICVHNRKCYACER